MGIAWKTIGKKITHPHFQIEKEDEIRFKVFDVHVT
jgi:hypothetical protein